MYMRRLVRAAEVGIIAGLLATPAAAQIDPLFNNLQCYRISGKAFPKRLQLENQFGKALVVKLKPALLCLPTKKTCCEEVTQAGATGCNVIPCYPDPGPNQPQPVDHFECYRLLSPKLCADDACTTFRRWPTGKARTMVSLGSQFQEETTPVGLPRYFCIPVVKTVVDPEAACLSAGGTVSTSSCCTNVGDFPNFCTIGPCGCSPSHSHTVKVCRCPVGFCFDGNDCITVGASSGVADRDN